MRLQLAVDEPTGRGDEQRTSATRIVDRAVSDERHGRQWRRFGRHESDGPEERLWRRRLRLEQGWCRYYGRKQGDRRWRDGGGRRWGVAKVVRRRYAANRREHVERGYVPGQGTAARGQGAGRCPKFGSRALGIDQVSGGCPGVAVSVVSARPSHRFRHDRPFASLLGRQRLSSDNNNII